MGEVDRGKVVLIVSAAGLATALQLLHEQAQILRTMVRESEVGAVDTMTKSIESLKKHAALMRDTLFESADQATAAEAKIALEDVDRQAVGMAQLHMLERYFPPGKPQ